MNKPDPDEIPIPESTRRKFHWWVCLVYDVPPWLVDPAGNGRTRRLRIEWQLRRVHFRLRRGLTRAHDRIEARIDATHLFR